MPSKKELVLVVDDDIRILRMLQLTLEAEGYRVVRASGSQVALDIFVEEAPDLVLWTSCCPVWMGVLCVSAFASFHRCR